MLIFSYLVSELLSICPFNCIEETDDTLTATVVEIISGTQMFQNPPTLSRTSALVTSQSPPRQGSICCQRFGIKTEKLRKIFIIVSLQHILPCPRTRGRTRSQPPMTEASMTSEATATAPLCLRGGRGRCEAPSQVERPAAGHHGKQT